MAGTAVPQRVLVKLSGEALAGEKGYGIDLEVAHWIASEIKAVVSPSLQVGIVVGGGNIFRGTGVTAKRDGIDRATADYMGMLSTIINSLALQDALEKEGCFTRVQTAIPMERVAEPYIRRRAIRHLEKGRVVIFAAGIGNPYFSTDTAAVLRAIEIKANIVLKATKVDGMYSADPNVDQTATKYDRLTLTEALEQGLQAMDATALTLARDNKLPIRVFSLFEPGSFRAAIRGKMVGTLIEPA